MAAQEALAWRADWFSCAVLDEVRVTDLRTDAGGRQREETVRREGRLVVTRDSVTRPAGLALMAWYETLALTRTSADGTLQPDTDGVLGGRFTGTLGPSGTWTAESQPYVPDRVRDASDVGRTLDDLLPRLPGFVLRPGGRFADTTGTSFERLADSTADGEQLIRLRVTRRWTRPLTLATGEVSAESRDRGTEESRVVLSPRRGLLRMDRRTLTEADLPKGEGMRGPVRAALDERLQLIRRLDATVDDCR